MYIISYLERNCTLYFFTIQSNNIKIFVPQRHRGAVKQRLTVKSQRLWIRFSLVEMLYQGFSRYCNKTCPQALSRKSGGTSSPYTTVSLPYFLPVFPAICGIHRETITLKKNHLIVFNSSNVSCGCIQPVRNRRPPRRINSFS